ncbi:MULTISPECIES: hypothetical protein [unclassified Pantoea]|uniref:hypothetical protein n=1 Tax=unclassified Pantoea TaxID=2630326 RepID=UPI002477A938|nr:MULTISPECIES: hypothetical protein [unclassified Pantoea]GME31039.1 hypothetical protein ACJ3_07290 [Pantoea sp. QMID3]GME31286.1 hypothetical protein ACJ1_07240 [Pantoea sp. QMID1]GME51333.1 hypothetical protein ACJ4_07290 [Pantoea sp. QMID4]GME52549.1 hypothetical protein ACJ2_07280 [Pantoea sp. QMID2]
MSKAVSVNWIVRFPLGLYAKVRSHILNDCISEAMIGPNVFTRYEDRYFVVANTCDAIKTLEKFILDLNSASSSHGVEVFHIPQGRMSSFAVDIEGDGQSRPRFD